MTDKTKLDELIDNPVLKRELLYNEWQIRKAFALGQSSRDGERFLDLLRRKATAEEKDLSDVELAYQKGFDVGTITQHQKIVKKIQDDARLATIKEIENWLDEQLQFGMAEKFNKKFLSDKVSSRGEDK